jgi:isoleucyl-tRNA synthetase
MRKEEALAVSDRIRLWVIGDDEVREAAEAHRDWIADEVLARELVVGAGPEEGSNHAARDVELDGLHARVAFTRE